MSNSGSRKIGASPAEIREVITLLKRVSTAPGTEMKPRDAKGACRDSDDDQIIGWVLALGVDFRFSCTWSGLS